MKDPCDFSIQEEYLTIPKAGESPKDKEVEHFGPSGIEKINNNFGPTLMSPRMCVGCRNFTNSKNGVGYCQKHEIDRLERDYQISYCFE